jgi:hypothetical protein
VANKYLMRCFYLTVLLALLCWPVPIRCQSCPTVVHTESVMARIASGWPHNFFCGFECANKWLEAHPIERDDEGSIVQKW